MLLIVSKMFFFLHKEGLRGLAPGPRFVWVIVCVWDPLGMQMKLLQRSFDQDIDLRNVEKKILYEIDPIKK